MLSVFYTNFIEYQVIWHQDSWSFMIQVLTGKVSHNPYINCAKLYMGKFSNNAP